ncbi:hypothetical protein H4R24_001356 [Coemansia sp. RSA 988]|nr:hypothetical protein H4R24_001356 [Coemansia sp. RSA 988]
MRFSFCTTFLAIVALFSLHVAAGSNCGIGSKEIKGASKLLTFINYGHNVEGVKRATKLLIDRYVLNKSNENGELAASVSRAITDTMGGDTDHEEADKIFTKLLINDPSFTAAGGTDNDCGITANDVTGASILLDRLQYSHDVKGVKKAALILIHRFGFSDIRSKSSVQVRVSMGIDKLMNDNKDHEEADKTFTNIIINGHKCITCSDNNCDDAQESSDDVQESSPVTS